MWLVPKGSSSLRRSRPTYTSTMFGSPAKSNSHTPARIWSLDTTCPARRTRNASTSNSRRVRSTSVPLDHARRPAVSRRTAPTVSGDRVAATGAPQQGPHPGDQHRERERLGQVVVGAGVERLGLVEVAVLGGEHQDRRPVAGAAEVGAQHVPVAPGQHDVEHDQVVAALGRHPPAVVAVGGHVDGEALALQARVSRRRRSCGRPRRRAASRGTSAVQCPLSQLNGR